MRRDAINLMLQSLRKRLPLSKICLTAWGASLLLIAAPVAAQSSDTGATPAHQPRLAVVPQVKRLPNGMRYVIVPRQSRAGQDRARVSFRMHVEGGWLAEAPGEQGLAHLIEHLELEGTSERTAADLIALRDTLTVASEWGAWTSPQASEYFFSSNGNDIASLDRLIAFLRGVVSDIKFDASTVDRQRQIVINEMALREPGNERLYARVHALAPGSALDLAQAYRSPDVATARVNAIERLYRRIYRPENVTLTIVGDVDATEVEAVVRKHFVSWASTNQANTAEFKPIRPVLQGDRRLPVSFDTAPAGLSSVLVSSVFAIPVADDDPNARTRQQAVYRLLTTIVNQRLAIAALRSGLGPFGFSIHEESGIFRTWQWEATPDGTRWKDALTLLLRQIALLDAQGIDDRELTTARRIVRRDLSDERDWRRFGTNFQRAERLAAMVAAGEAPQDPADDGQRDADAVTSVDLARVNAAWRSMSRTAPMQVRVESVDLAGLVDPADAITQIVRDQRQRGADSAAASPRRPVLGLAYQPGKRAAITSDRLLPEGVRRIVFANGVALNLVNRQHEGKWLEIEVDVAAPPARSRLSYCDAMALPVLFEAGGSRKQSAADLREAVIATDIRFSPFQASADGLVTRVSARKEDAETAILSLYAMVADPGFRGDGVDTAKAQLLSIRRAQDNDPVGALWSAVERFSTGSAGRDAAFDTGCLERATMARSRALIGSILSQGHLEIAVAGNIDEARMIDLIAATFGTLPNAKPLSNVPATTAWTAPADLKIVAPGGAVQQTAHGLIWDVVPAATVRERAVQRLFVSAFSRLLYSRWLEKDDLSYAPRIELNPVVARPDRSVLFAASVVAPERLDELSSAAMEVAAKMATTPIDGAMLDICRRLEIDGVRGSYNEDRVWAYQAVQLGRKPSAVAEWRSLDAEFATVTADEIRDYARKTFAQKPTSITYGPKARVGAAAPLTVP